MSDNTEFNEYELVSAILRKHLGATQQMTDVAHEVYEVLHKSRMYWWRVGADDAKAIYRTPINEEE